MKKILTTGAAGFIGSHLVEHLLEDGVKPQDLQLFIPPWESLMNLPQEMFEIVIGDIRNKDQVKKAMNGVDIVYHLAAKTVIDGGIFDCYKDTNVDGTKNLLEAAAKEKVKKFIYFSSISVFGLPAWKGDMENYDETFPKEPSEPYGKTKLESEQLVIAAFKKWKLPYIIIRPTTVYGPRDKAGIAQLYKAIQMNIFFFIGSAKNKMDYVYVKDLVKAARIAEKSTIKNEDFIIGAGKPSTQQYIVERVAKSLGKDVPPIHVPKSIALWLAYMIKWISGLLHIRPLLFPARVKVLTANCYFDTKKAKKLLGYKPEFEIQKAMKQVSEWMKHLNNLD